MKYFSILILVFLFCSSAFAASGSTGNLTNSDTIENLTIEEANTQGYFGLVSGYNANGIGYYYSFKKNGINNPYQVPPFTFTVTSASATAGATYTNNSITYTVLATIASQTTLTMTVGTATGITQSGTTLTKTSGTGDSTITFSTVVAGKNAHCVSREWHSDTAAIDVGQIFSNSVTRQFSSRFYNRYTNLGIWCRYFCFGRANYAGYSGTGLV